jgi:hypothetical protein
VIRAGRAEALCSLNAGGWVLAGRRSWVRAWLRLTLRAMEGRGGAKGLLKARMNVGLRVPVEGTSGKGGVYAATELLARHRRAVLRWKVSSRDLE